MQLCRICKFKKSKGKKCDDEGEKFEIFTRKLNKNLVKIESALDSNMGKSQTTEGREIKIEEDLYAGVYRESYLEKNELQEEGRDNQLCSRGCTENQEFWNSGSQIELSMLMQGDKKQMQRNLFDLLSMP